MPVDTSYRKSYPLTKNVIREAEGRGRFHLPADPLGPLKAVAQSKLRRHQDPNDPFVLRKYKSPTARKIAREKRNKEKVN